ncbi:MAG: S8 family serine peptidase, partial [Oscillospiraceae bacterium]|nr:S8 family serine peptidase [Oscillospiraceae bacterium]
MKNTSLFRRFLSVVLVLAMVGSLLVPATAAAMPKVSQTTQELELIPMDPGELEPHKLGEISQEDSIPMEEHKLTDIVRVSIELEEPATLDMGYSTMNIAHNSSAMAYRHALRAQQDAMTTKIESTIGSKLDVKLNLTLLANIISAEVMYGDIDRIKAVDGVKDVYLENFYEVPPGEDEPDQSNATQTIGANIAWGAGYTGAGSRLAILDTGVDMVHQSFDGEALEYALRQNAEEKGMTYEAYVESLHLLTAEEIDAVSSELHSKASGEQAYHSIKIPYAYNYQKLSYEATHEFDNAGDHGSHVAGISAANRFIKVGDEFKPALEEVQTQGVAPDAQIINMDVFNTSGTTPASAYMAAIEDAIILGCDSANLSLGGSAGLGFDYNGYEKLLNKLVECGMVVAIAMGNDYMWYDTPCNSQMNSALYADDVNFHTGGSPGTFTNSLAVASSDNGGAQAELQFGERSVKYVEGGFDGNSSITTLAGQDLQYVFFDNTAVGEDEETGDPIDLLAPYADVIAGKVVLVSRGSSTFTEKVNAAGAAGAIACIVYNNQAGSISMLLDGLTTTIPAVSITQADAFAIRAMSEAVTDPESGEVLYLTGTMSLPELIQTDNMTQVSSFSSYGVPGTLVNSASATALSMKTFTLPSGSFRIPMTEASPGVRPMTSSISSADAKDT